MTFEHPFYTRSVKQEQEAIERMRTAKIDKLRQSTIIDLSNSLSSPKEFWDHMRDQNPKLASTFKDQKIIPEQFNNAKVIALPYYQPTNTTTVKLQTAEGVIITFSLGCFKSAEEIVVVE